MELRQKFPGLAGLTSQEDVESAILKSKKVMEESRAVTSKNVKRTPCWKDGNYENSIEDSLKPCEKSTNKELGLNSGLSPGVMFQEIQSLNLKLAGQLAYIKTLENKVAELQMENEKLGEKNEKIKVKHREEIFYVTQMYEQRIRGTVPLSVSELEGRMKELEEKIKMQDSQFLWMEEKVENIGKKAKGGKSEKKLERCGKVKGNYGVKGGRCRDKGRSGSESRVLASSKKKFNVRDKQKN